jgi:hypothetical protein
MMNEKIQWGLLFALERDLAGYLEFIKGRPEGWWASPEADSCKYDAANLVAALDWLLGQKLPKYVNAGYLRRDLELLREKL